MSGTPFWSTRDPCVGVDTLIRKHNGDRVAAIKTLLGKYCSYLIARQCAIAVAHCFGLSEAEFMRIWKTRNES